MNDDAIIDHLCTQSAYANNERSMAIANLAKADIYNVAACVKLVQQLDEVATDWSSLLHGMVDDPEGMRGFAERALTAAAEEKRAA